MEGMPIPDYVRDNYPVSEGWEDHTFKMPTGMDGLDLPALVNVPENSVVSFWKPTKEEIGQLARGHYVALRIIGSQPPVALYVV